MTEEIIQQLIMVRNALNNVTVSGKQNLSNLGASIDILDRIIEKAQKEKENSSAKG